GPRPGPRPGLVRVPTHHGKHPRTSVVTRVSRPVPTGAVPIGAGRAGRSARAHRDGRTRPVLGLPTSGGRALGNRTLAHRVPGRGRARHAPVWTPPRTAVHRGVRRGVRGHPARLRVAAHLHGVGGAFRHHAT